MKRIWRLRACCTAANASELLALPHLCSCSPFRGTSFLSKKGWLPAQRKTTFHRRYISNKLTAVPSSINKTTYTFKSWNSLNSSLHHKHSCTYLFGFCATPFQFTLPDQARQNCRVALRCVERCELGMKFLSPMWHQIINYRQRNSTDSLKLKTRTHPFNGFFPGLPGRAGTRKVKPIWILLKQETVSGSSISWAICKSTYRSRQITMPVPHHSFFTGRMPFLPPNQQRQSTEGK